MTTENFIETSQTFDFRYSAAAHFYRSRGTLLCRGTQVGKHWPNVLLDSKSLSL